MENERSAWIFLNHIPELGPVRFHRLLHAAQSAEAILELPVSGLLAADVPLDLAQSWHRAFRDAGNLRWRDAELTRLSKGLCRVATELDEDYPSPLRELYDRPPVLYYKGRWPLPVKAVVGLVGTRYPSPYGKAVAERLATDLSLRGVTTVSGLARGIDSYVHAASMRANGLTVAVLGCGLGHVYPKENKALYAAIAESGALVSEFSYDVEPESGNFPRRNRIISGLAEGVVVIEARQRSGALITARCAAEQGRDVFAVPGSIYQGTSAGCHRLLKEGARLVESASEILDELGIIKEDMPAETAAGPRPALNDLEQKIIELLSAQALSADEISRGTAQRFERVANSLLSLELKGLIQTLPGQRYAKN